MARSDEERIAELEESPQEVDLGEMEAEKIRLGALAKKTKRDRVIDWGLGLFGGAVVGAIVAVNLIITVGIGYDVSLAEVYRENPLVGIVTTAILVAGPILGVALMRKLRRDRNRSTP
ncbi:MAG TPA: hypothetical protein VI193_00380 [Acidimicrobiia bacterium]